MRPLSLNSQTLPVGATINVPNEAFPQLREHVEIIPPNCKYWGQVCRSTQMYMDDCTGTGDEQCRIFRFLALNTRSDGKGELAA